MTDSSTPSGDGPSLDLDDAVGRRVPDRVHQEVGHDPREPGRVGGDEDAWSTAPSSRTPRARATESALASASLTTSPSATGCRAEAHHAGMDPRQLEEVVDHPHHPVDLCSHLGVVARRVVGEPVLERLGHRAQARRAAYAGRGRPTTPTRAATAPGRPRGHVTRRAWRWSVAARPTAARTRQGRRRQLRRTRRSRRRRGRVPAARATNVPTQCRPRGRRARRRSRRRRPRARRHPGRVGKGTSPGRSRACRPARRARRPSRPRRSASALRHGGRARSGRRRRRATPPDHAAVVQTMVSWSWVMSTAPSGSRRPRRSPGAPGRVGSASTFSRSRRTCTVTVDWSPNDQPHTRWSSSSRENAWPGWERKKRSRSNSRDVSESRRPARVAVCSVESTTRSLSETVPRDAASGSLPGSPQDGVDSEDELAGAEGLGHVVVGASLQPDHAVGLGAQAPSA